MRSLDSRKMPTPVPLLSPKMVAGDDELEGWQSTTTSSKRNEQDRSTRRRYLAKPFGFLWVGCLAEEDMEKERRMRDCHEMGDESTHEARVATSCPQQYFSAYTRQRLRQSRGTKDVWPSARTVVSRECHVLHRYKIVRTRRPAEPRFDSNFTGVVDRPDPLLSFPS